MRYMLIVTLLAAGCGSRPEPIQPMIKHSKVPIVSSYRRPWDDTDLRPEWLNQTPYGAIGSVAYDKSLSESESLVEAITRAKATLLLLRKSHVTTSVKSFQDESKTDAISYSVVNSKSESAGEIGAVTIKATWKSPISQELFVWVVEK